MWSTIRGRGGPGQGPRSRPTGGEDPYRFCRRGGGGVPGPAAETCSHQFSPCRGGHRPGTKAGAPRRAGAGDQSQRAGEICAKQRVVDNVDRVFTEESQRPAHPGGSLWAGTTAVPGSVRASAGPKTGNMMFGPSPAAGLEQRQDARGGVLIKKRPCVAH